MKVIVMIADNELTHPRVFASVLAMLDYYVKQGWEKDQDVEMAVENLRKGKNFSDKTTFWGWVEVIS